MYVYTQTPTHTSIHMYPYTYILTCLYKYVYVYNNICIYIYIYMYIHTYVYMYIHIYIYTHTCIYIYIQIHTEHAQSHCSLRAWLPVPALFVTRCRSCFRTPQPTSPVPTLTFLFTLSHARSKHMHILTRNTLICISAANGL